MAIGQLPSLGLADLVKAGFAAPRDVVMSTIPEGINFNRRVF